MGVTKVWTYICDCCTSTVVKDGSGMPKGWFHVLYQMAAEQQRGCFCGGECAATTLADWELMNPDRIEAKRQEWGERMEHGN